MKLKIYLDTSVISYYVKKTEYDILEQAHYQLTRQWWRKFATHHSLFISVFVINEIEKGDKHAAMKRLKAVEGIPILDTSVSVDRLSRIIVKELNIPEKARMDGYHLAVAAMNSQDYIVSWNFKHMANARVRRIYKAICGEEGLVCPDISTPEEMLGEVL